MKENTEPQMIYVGKKLAYYSAVIGTIILITYLISHANYLIELGLIYVLLAFVVNGIFLLVLLLELIYNRAYWKSYMATIIAMLLNIPLSLLYISLATHHIF